MQLKCLQWKDNIKCPADESLKFTAGNMLSACDVFCICLWQTLTHEWMFTAGDDLSDIIGQKNKADIKEHLEPVVMHYPDFR